MCASWCANGGIRRIRTEHPEVDLIVMDDGFQHRYVEAKINVVLIDATRPVQEDRMLPLGSLRDVPGQLHRAHYFIVTKCPEEMNPLDRRIMRKVLIEAAYQNIYFTRMEAFRPQPVFGEAPAEGFDPGTEVILMSGIGNPAQFVRGASACYRVVGELRFEDAGGAYRTASGCNGAHDREGRRQTCGARQGARRDSQQIVLPTDKHFIHRRFGNGFSSKP